MTAYYNDHERFAAAWLRELIAAGHVTTGDVDERDIQSIAAADVKQYDRVHLFAGIGGWDLALRQAGWSGPVWTASCPCQPFSAAGKRSGEEDPRHLWPHVLRLVSECRPVTLFGEQVASRDGLAWFDSVSTDLEDCGYAVGAVVAPACGFGAPHRRERLYFVADDDDEGRSLERVDGLHENRHAQSRYDADRCGATNGNWLNADWLPCRDGKARPTEPGTFPLAHGVPNRVGRLRGYGNAIVVPQAAAFVKAYMENRSHGESRVQAEGAP